MGKIKNLKWRGTKAEFVRSMPRVSTGAVIRYAASVGLRLSSLDVARARYKERAATRSEAIPAAPKTAEAEAAAAAAAARPVRKNRRAAKPAAAVKKWHGTKAKFIRSMPGASAKDVRAAARRAGISMALEYVDYVRCYDRKRERAGLLVRHYDRGVKVPLLAAKPRRGTKARVEPVVIAVDRDAGTITAQFKKLKRQAERRSRKLRSPHTKKVLGSLRRAIKSQNSVTDAIESLKGELSCGGCRSAQQIAGIARDVENSADLDQREAFFLLLSLGSKGLRDALQDASERAVLRPKNSQRQQVAKLAARLGARVIAQLIAGVEQGLIRTSGTTAV